MYYKITDRQSAPYKALRAYMVNIYNLQQTNHKDVEEKVKIPFKSWINTSQPWGVIRTYGGFEFTETENIDPKVWVGSKEFKGFFEPNKRTKLGKCMLKHFSSLDCGCLMDLTDIIDPNYTENRRRVVFPTVYLLKNDYLVLYIDDQVRPEDAAYVEITCNEWESYGDELHYNRYTDNLPIE